MTTGHNRFECVMTLLHLPHMALCLDYWFDKNNMNKVRETILTIHSAQAFLGGIFQ